MSSPVKQNKGPAIAFLVTVMVLSSLMFIPSCTRDQQQAGSPLISHYFASQYALSAGDGGMAADQLKQALREEPDNPVLIEEAFSLFLRNGDYEAALDQADKLIALDKVNETAAMLLSLRAFKRRDEEALARWVEEMDGTGFDRIASPLLKAWVAAEEGKVDEGLEALDGMGGSRIFRPYQRLQRAFLLDYYGRTEAAEGEYQLLLAEETLDTVQPILAYGQMLARNNRLPEARSLYQRYIDQLGGNAILENALENLGNVRAQASPIETPERALALTVLSVAGELARGRSLAPAILYARLGTYLEPGLADGHMLLGNLFVAEEDERSAIRAFAQIPEDSNLFEEAQIRAAYAMNDLDRTEEAIDLLKAYIRRKGESQRIREALGDLYRLHERWAESIVHYDRAIAMIDEPGESDWFVYFTRGISYERLDNWPQAEADMLTALDLNPGQADVLNYLGYTWIEKGMHIERAKEMIESAAEQRPESGAIIDSLGWVYYLLGDYEEAVKHLERAVALEPQDPTLNDHLGDAYWQVGRLIEARYQWQHALDMGPEEDEAERIREKIEVGLGVVMADSETP